ncbi:hypothetical protein [Actinophytocola sp. KF-1]
MTDTTTVKPGEKDFLPCEECDSTEHTTSGHFEGGSSPAGHFEGGSAPKGTEN